MLEGSSLKPLEQSAVKVSHFNLSVRPIHWKRENLSHKRSLKVRAQNGYFIPWLVGFTSFLFALNMLCSTKSWVMVYEYGNAFCNW